MKGTYPAGAGGVLSHPSGGGGDGESTPGHSGAK